MQLHHGLRRDAWIFSLDYGRLMGDPELALLGNPCVSVPGMYGPRGGPIGVQVIGCLDDDARCLAAAVFVEDALRKYQ
jgi:Asp-tRNA(Asn)/Glu-tRNA(Gln) amidotransferase A subunit family amidase